MMLSAVILAVVFVVVANIIWNALYRKNLPPGPIGLPIIGNLHQIGKGAFHELLRDFAENYGDIYSLQIGTRLTLVLNSADAIHEAFVKKAKQFSGRPDLSLLQFQGNRTGLSLTNVNEQQRKNKSITVRALQQLLSDKKKLNVLLQREMVKMNTLFENYVSNNTKFHPLIDFTKIITSISLSTIFGDDYAYENTELLDFIKTYQKLAAIGEKVDPLDFFDYRILKLLPNKRADNMRQLWDYMHNFVMGKIKDFQKDECKKQLGLINIYLYELSKNNSSDEIPKCEIEEMAQVLLEIAAGNMDSPIPLMVWAILYFAYYPDILNRCRKEILTVLGDKPFSIEYEAAMPYFTATIYDLLRLSTTAPISVPHATTEDVKLRSYDIPANTLVFPNLWAMNHDPKEWKEPNKLYPEHFLDDLGKVDATAVKKVSSFSFGVRRCPGDKFAFYELFVLLGTFIRKYDVNLVNPPEDLMPKKGLLLTPKFYEITLSHVPSKLRFTAFR